MYPNRIINRLKSAFMAVVLPLAGSVMPGALLIMTAAPVTAQAGATSRRTEIRNEYPIYTVAQDYVRVFRYPDPPAKPRENVTLKNNVHFTSHYLINPVLAGSQWAQANLEYALVAGNRSFQSLTLATAPRIFQDIYMNRLIAARGTILDFSNSIFSNVQLNSAIIPGVNLSHISANLSGFSYAFLSHGKANSFKAYNSGFNGVDWINADINDAIFSYCGMDGARFSLSRMQNCFFENVTGKGTQYSGSDLTNSRWRNFNIDGAFMLPVQAQCTDGNSYLYVPSLRSAILQDGSAINVDARGADLRNSRWVRVNMISMDLRGADLRGMSIEDCMVTGANIYGAQIDAKLRKIMLANGAIEKAYEDNPVQALDGASLAISTIKVYEKKCPSPSLKPAQP